MDVVAIAVTGASGLVGQRLLPRLAEESQVTRLIGLDVRDPLRRVRNLTFHRVDIGGGELKPLLEAAEVLVHLATVVDPVPDEALMARVNVEGTRRVLDAAAAVGVRKVIRVSTAAVYGAWPNNPVPLTEDATLRPNPGFAPAVQAAEVERLLAEWREEHPAVTVTTLRSAPVLGAGAERLPSRLLLGRPPLRVRGASPPVQAVHVDDLVAALLLAVGKDLPGTYNVAADGWLGTDDARELLPRSLLPPLPSELIERALARLWASGLGDIPPTVVPYLVYPWVVANDRLRAAGWRPNHTNEEAIIEGLDSLPSARYGRALLIGGAASVAMGIAAGAGWRILRRVRATRRPV
ncbi:MAG TPA: NAD-dependent epimerase/dehydratase family protein [Acidimicrobiia bacterium]|jgi:UDP-glucose 4-epimerase|nr:NAD-dependent epimerase/dehydratase family protein [Acidimicrobiia bacterium]